MFKGNICREAALYKTGGHYFDLDIQARVSMWDFADTKTNFVVPKIHKEIKRSEEILQACIEVTECNPIMKGYLELFHHFYDKDKHDDAVGVTKIKTCAM